MSITESWEARDYQEFPGINEGGLIGDGAAHVQLTACDFNESIIAWANDPSDHNKHIMSYKGDISTDAFVGFIRTVEDSSIGSDYDKAYLVGSVIVRLDEDRMKHMLTTPKGEDIQNPLVDVDPELRIQEHANNIMDFYMNGAKVADVIHDLYVFSVNQDLQLVGRAHPNIIEAEERRGFDLHTEFVGLEETRKEELIRHARDIGKIAIGVGIGLAVFNGVSEVFKSRWAKET